MVSEKVLQSCRVCVVGAGPSGLAAARELLKEGHSAVVLEQNHDIGGQWLYDAAVDRDDPLGRAAPLRVHSSIYASLRLLSPRETMGFTDFPFVVRKGRDTRRFPGHRELFLYLSDFCDWFGLRETVRCNTRVEYVAMTGTPELGGGGGAKWVVTSREKEEKVVEEVYDAVVVATGHYSQPRLPSIKELVVFGCGDEGMDAWRRRQMHSHVYRVPEPFRNEVVVLVGNSYTGQDLSVELAGVAKEVHLSAKSLQITLGQSKIISKHPNLHLHPQIESLREDGRVIFEDGACVVADSIIYCTGYKYSIPFLDTKGIVTVDDDTVGPLFEHTFPPSLAPFLSFVGIPTKVIGLPFFESQGRWIAQVLSGKRSLPSPEDMMKSVEEFHQSLVTAGTPKRDTHSISGFDYCDRYGDYSDFPHLESWRKELMMLKMRNAEADLEGFRDQWDDDAEALLREVYAHTSRSSNRSLLPLKSEVSRTSLDV